MVQFYAKKLESLLIVFVYFCINLQFFIIHFYLQFWLIFIHHILKRLCFLKMFDDCLQYLTFVWSYLQQVANVKQSIFINLNVICNKRWILLQCRLRFSIWWHKNSHAGINWVPKTQLWNLGWLKHCSESFYLFLLSNRLTFGL